MPQYEAVIATTMYVTRLTCDAIYANGNGSILSITNITQIGPSPVQPSELRLLYNNTFNNPLNPSPLNISFLLSFGNYLGTTDSFSAIKAFLALPYVVFQPLNPWFKNTYNLDLSHSTTTATWSSGWAISRIVIRKWTVITFAIMMLGVYFCCVASLFFVFFRPSPPVTQFPLLDFASRITSGTSSVQNVLKDGTFSGGFRKMLQDKVLYLGVTLDKREDRADVSASNARFISMDVNENIAKVTEAGKSDPQLSSVLIAEEGSNENEGSATPDEIQELIGIEGNDQMVEESASPFPEISTRESGTERIGFAFKQSDVKRLKRNRNK